MQPQSDAARQERAERLARRAGQRHLDGVVGQPVSAPPPGQLAAEHRADGAVHVADRQLQPDGRALGQRPLSQQDQGVIQSRVQTVILIGDPVPDCAGRQLGNVQHRAQVQAGRLLVAHGDGGVQQFGVPDGFL